MPVWLISPEGYLTSDLPAEGLTAIVLNEDQVEQVVAGYLRWDAATLALVPVLGWDPEQVDTDREEARRILGQAIPTLRQWAEDSRNTTVTSGNAVATLNVMIDRLGIFFDRFADLLETR